MAKAPKTNCPHCDAKMPIGVSFCPSCAHPTPWCSYDDRVKWEVLQYRQLRERASAPAAVAAPVVEAAPERTYKRETVLKQPVTVKIQRRFGARTGNAVGATAVADGPVIEAPKPVPPIVEAQAPEADTGAVEQIAPSPPKPAPRPARRPTPARPSQTTPPVERSTTHAPARPRRPLQPKTEAPKVEPAKAETATQALPEGLEEKLQLIDELAARVTQLEARLNELSRAPRAQREPAKREPWWRRFLAD